MNRERKRERERERDRERECERERDAACGLKIVCVRAIQIGVVVRPHHEDPNRHSDFGSTQRAHVCVLAYCVVDGTRLVRVCMWLECVCVCVCL